MRQAIMRTVRLTTRATNPPLPPPRSPQLPSPLLPSPLLPRVMLMKTGLLITGQREGPTLTGQRPATGLRRQSQGTPPPDSDAPRPLTPPGLCQTLSSAAGAFSTFSRSSSTIRWISAFLLPPPLPAHPPIFRLPGCRLPGCRLHGCRLHGCVPLGSRPLGGICPGRVFFAGWRTGGSRSVYSSRSRSDCSRLLPRVRRARAPSPG